jgi:hypothetical protein
MLGVGRVAVADTDRIVAIGLLSARDLKLLGTGFKRAYPVDDAADFTDILRRIDQADLRHGKRLDDRARK